MDKQVIEVLRTYHGFTLKEAKERVKTMSEESKKEFIEAGKRFAKYSFYND